MREVWVLVEHVSRLVGHGESALVTQLAMRGPYGEGGPHPAFMSEAAALTYLADLKPICAIKPMQLPVQQQTAIPTEDGHEP